ncbi:porin [Parapusillimonas sp. JC17]|uniref:porin n=1 Tax=Parapusillimonas sp. JC17 TaxID=3445768 RepID=UPI003FA08A6B
MDIQTLTSVEVPTSLAAGEANESLTLYGLVDGGGGYTRFESESGKASRSGMWDGGQSSNRWGIRGVENLGDGLSAAFNLEGGFSLADGKQGQSGRLYGRQATLALKSESIGELAFGRQGNIGYHWLTSVATPFGNNFNQARSAGTFSVAEVRYDNQIQYKSAKLSGFQFGLGYSFNADGEQRYTVDGNSNQNVRALTAGVRYESGPLSAVVTYDQLKDAGNNSGTTAKSWNLASSYDFEVLKVHLGFGITNDGWFGTPSQLRNSDLSIGSIKAFNDGFRAYSYSVGVSIPTGTGGKILAGWGGVSPRKNGVAYLGRNLATQQIISLAYSHKLSSRTSAYVLGTYGKNIALVAGNKTQSFGVGLRHSF